MRLTPDPVVKGGRKYRAAMVALAMDFVLALLMLGAVTYADVLAETVGTITTLWLTGSGAHLAIFVGGNVATHKVQGDE